MEKQIYKTPESSKIVSVITEENRVVIEYEKIEDAFVPKNGDFVKTKYGSILIYSGVDIFDNAIISYAGYRMGHSTTVTGTGWGLYCDIIGLATESERQQLLNAIAKDGKRWNAKLKRIEDIVPVFKAGDCVIGRDEYYPHGAKFIEYTRDNNTARYDSDSNGCGFKYLRYATEAEEGELVNRLRADGKLWNAEKKCIEKLRERAKKGCCYWSALNLGKFEPVSVSDTYDDMDNGRYESGNYFLTESDCQHLCDKLNETVQNFE